MTTERRALLAFFAILFAMCHIATITAALAFHQRCAEALVRVASTFKPRTGGASDQTAQTPADKVPPVHDPCYGRSCMKRFLAPVLLLTGFGASAATYSATPATYSTIMQNLKGGDVVRWADPAEVVPTFYDRANRTYSPPVEIDFGTALVQPQRFSSPAGMIIRGGVFKNDLRAAITGLMLGSAQNVKVLGSKFVGGRNGMTMSDAKDIYLENIQCDSMGSDCIDIPNSVNVEVRGLHCYGDALIPLAHPDCVQTWAFVNTQTPTNLYFENVQCEGVIQCVADFVHRERAAGPDPYPVDVRIKGLRARTHAGHAIAFDGCLGTCSADDVTVIGDEVSTFVPHVVIPNQTGFSIAKRGVHTMLPAWVPSTERYPCGAAAVVPATRVDPCGVDDGHTDSAGPAG